MTSLTEDMQRVVLEQKLGFAATVCPDGTPNLSPKGTTTVRTLLTLQVGLNAKAATCWPFKSPLTDSNRRPPPYHALPNRCRGLPPVADRLV